MPGTAERSGGAWFMANHLGAECLRCTVAKAAGAYGSEIGTTQAPNAKGQ